MVDTLMYKKEDRVSCKITFSTAWDEEYMNVMFSTGEYINLHFNLAYSKAISCLKEKYKDAPTEWLEIFITGKSIYEELPEHNEAFDNDKIQISKGKSYWEIYYDNEELING